MIADGSSQTNRTNNLAQDARPDWQPVRPQNGKIAFASSRDGNDEIYTMNADGTSQTLWGAQTRSGSRRNAVLVNKSAESIPPTDAV
jgi:Tol biopolymer transport system component